MSQRLQEPIPGKVGTFAGLSYEYLPNGEVVYDGLNVGKLPTNFFDLLIAKFCQVGKILRARIDDLAYIGQVILTSLCSYGGFNLIAAFALGVLITQKALGPAPASFFEKAFTAPYVFFVKNDYPSSDVVPPIFNFGAINWQPTIRVSLQDIQTLKGITKTNELSGFVAEEIASLNSTEKLVPGYKMAPLRKISDSWTPVPVSSDSSPKTEVTRNETALIDVTNGGIPDTLMTIQKDSDTIFVFTVVLDGNRWAPWSGVFHKKDSKWSYFDFSVPGVPSVKTKGYATITPDQIPDFVAKAFPETVVQQKEVK